MSTPTIETIIDSFPNQTIPAIEGEPKYETIKNVEKLLIENAASVHSTLGGGNHGFLGVILTPEKYQLVTGHTFEPYTNPGALPTLPPNATQHQILNANAAHKENLRLWKEQTFVIKAIKNLLTRSVEKKYIADLHNSYTGYNNLTIQEILEYLYTNYGDLDEADLEQTELKFSSPFDPNEPFGIFIDKIEDCIDLAEAAGAPYTNEQIVQKAFNAISKAQCYPEGTRDWRRKNASDKTWVNFKSFFAQEAKDYRKANASTAKSTGYQTANANNQALLEAQNDFKSVTDSFIAEFKQACNQEPKTQQAAYTSNEQNLHTIIKELRDQNKEMMKLITKLSEGKENVTPPQSNNITPISTKKYPTWYYCYSCGANTSHASDNCNSKWKLASHKDNATFKNTMGGSARKCHYPHIRKLMK
jgi:hypothetical protein